MNKVLKAKYVLPFLFLLVAVSAFAQSTAPPEPDDEFNVFLLSFAAIFICTLIGAAIVGAFAAALFFISLVALIGFGVLSTSIAAGLYKRSVAAGFKTLLVIVFGAGCAACGIVCLLLLHHFYPRQLSVQTALFGGAIAGALGGIVTGLSTFTIIQTVLRNITRRVSAVS